MKVLTFFMILLVSATAGASAPTNAFRVTPYLQNPASDAMTVMWLAQTNGTATITLCEAGEGGSQTRRVEVVVPRLAEEFFYEARHTNKQKVGCQPFSVPWQYRVRFTGLTPDTRYSYSVALNGGAGYQNSFRTAPSSDRPVRVICYADSETEPESTGSAVAWEDPACELSSRRYFVDQTTGYASNIVHIARREPDLVLIAGDLAEMGSRQVDWDEFWRHNAGELNDLAGSVPILAAPGNHEYHEYGNVHGEAGMRKFLSYFEFATNGAAVDADQQERFHRLDYGPATFIFLDTNNGPDNDASRDTNLALSDKTCRAPDFNPGSAQYEWLEKQLADARENSRFTFIVSHQCPFSTGYHGRANGDPGLEKGGGEFLSGTPTRVLTDIFMKYGVDAWFAGHDEMYEHSRLQGVEIMPSGATRPHDLHIYDLGSAGDGLRGRARTAKSNQHEVFHSHKDSTEIWENGFLVDGGKHYGHMELNITTNTIGSWEARLTPAYIFVTTNRQGVACGFERRVYADETVIVK